IDRHDTLQGDEFEGVDLSGHVLAHYFSLNEARFASWLSRRAAPEAGPARGVERAFAELGTRLERAFARVDYDQRAFPALAAAALRDARLEREASSLDVVRWVLAAPALPQQDDLAAKFGDPPVTVYRGRRFFIQVLLWREGSTAIHG